MPYASLERVIEENKDLYDNALRRTQATLKSETPDWEPWTGFFLRSLKTQKDSLARRLNDEKAQQQGDDELPSLSVEILALFKGHARLDAGRIEELTGANRSTLKVRLRELVEAGRLRKHGKARATWYSL